MGAISVSSGGHPAPMVAGESQPVLLQAMREPTVAKIAGAIARHAGRGCRPQR
jgi:hypothetical protein